MDQATTHAGAGWIPAGDRRRSRRSRRKATERITKNARAELMAARKAELDAEKAERKNAAYLPAGGAAGRLGSGTGNWLTPLDDGPRPLGMPDEAWHDLVASRRRLLIGALAESALGRPLESVEHTALDLALRSAVEHAAVTGNTVPTLPMVVEALFHPVLTDAGTAASLAELTADGRHVG